MIIIKMSAGLGNQLFQYALYRELLFRGKETKVELTWFLNTADMCYYPYQLDRLGFKAEEDKDNIIDGKAHYFDLMYVKCAFGELGYRYYPDIFNLENSYVYGYWINPKYFVHVADDLKAEVRFPDSGDDMQKWEDEIGNCNAVSIHVRKNDYDYEFFDKYADSNYYLRAMDYVRKKTDNPVFFIFSNNIPYTRELFKDHADIRFVDINDRNNGIGDMKLISLCSHNILSPSTFGWWAAFFNKNKDKMVICPEMWYESVPSKELILKDWIIL